MEKIFSQQISLGKNKFGALICLYFIIINLVLIQSSCQSSGNDTLLTNEGSEPQKEVVEIDPYEEEYYEYRLFEKSNFKQNQIKPDLVYVFADECALYKDETRELVIEHLDYGTPLTVLQKGDEFYRDSSTNAYGSLWLVEHQNQIGYIFSGFVQRCLTLKSQIYLL